MEACQLFSRPKPLERRSWKEALHRAVFCFFSPFFFSLYNEFQKVCFQVLGMLIRDSESELKGS